jgi:tetratricopeptide (TPR) repeat protein
MRMRGWCVMAVMALANAVWAEPAAEALAKARQPNRPGGQEPTPGLPAVIWDKEQLDLALERAREGLSKAPGDPALAAVALEAAARRAQSATLEELVRTLPATAMSEAAHRALGEGMLDMATQNEGDAALRIAGLWLERFPEVREARRGAARVWMLSGGVERALSALSGWSAAAPGDAEWTRTLGTAYVLIGEMETAVRWLASARGDDEARRLRAMLQAARGDESARAELKSISDPKGTRRDLPQLLREELAKPKPDDWQLRDLAIRLVEARHFVDAAVAVHAVQRLPGWTQKEQLNLADLFRKLREWNREVQALLPLVVDVDREGKTRTGVSRGDFHFRIGRALFHAGRLEEALREYALSGAAGKDDPELHFHVAKVYQQQGKNAEANAIFEKVAAQSGGAAHIEKARKELDKQKPR